MIILKILLLDRKGIACKTDILGVTMKRKPDPLMSAWIACILCIYLKSWIECFKNSNKGECNKNVLPKIGRKKAWCKLI